MPTKTADDVDDTLLYMALEDTMAERDRLRERLAALERGEKEKEGP